MTVLLPKFLVFIALPLFLLVGCGYFPRLVLMQDPLTAEEHNNLGVAYESEGKYKLALSEYKKAHDKDQNLIIPIVNMANVYFKLEEYKKAEKYYLKALKEDEMNLEAANNLASLYIERNQSYDEGLKYLNKAISSRDETPAYVLDTLGLLYMKIGDKNKSIEMFKEACEKAGDDQDLIEEIELHLREIGDTTCSR